MNERFKELAEQAGIAWDDKYHWYVSHEELTKFMHLVANKAAEIAWNKFQGTTASYAIKDYFKVDE